MNRRIKKKKGIISNVNEEEVVNLNKNLAEYILPRLIKYREVIREYPSHFQSLKRWQDALDKMIFSFDRIVNENWINVTAGIDAIKREQDKFQEGMRLFSDNFTSLWCEDLK